MLAVGRRDSLRYAPAAELQDMEFRDDSSLSHRFPNRCGQHQQGDGGPPNVCLSAVFQIWTDMHTPRLEIRGIIA